MFRKILAATTTALVAGALSLGAVAGPALADDPSTPPAATDTSSTTSSDATTPPSTTPESSTPPASTPDATAPAATAPDATPPAPTTPEATTPESTPPQSPTPAAALATTSAAVDEAPVGTTCLPATAVSYSYYPDTNSGVITVSNPDPATFSNELCDPFYVTAASWAYTTADTYPQTLVATVPANGGKKITGVGDPIPFGTPVACGQGDIYATYDAGGVPPIPSKLNGPHDPYDEHFLMDMGFSFSGPSTTTYTVTDQSCHVVDPVTPTVTKNTACDAPGSITWNDVPGKVTYALTQGNGQTGFNKVTATAVSPWIFPDSTTTHVFKIWLGTIKGCDVVVPDPTAASAVCQSGVQGDGSITVGLTTGVVYRITGSNGFDVTPTVATTPVPAGAYTVTASPLNSNYQLDYTHPNQWPFAITVPSAIDCGDLPTFADFTIEATPSNATCSTSGGTITVGPADFASVVNFFVDGKPVAPGKVKVAPGNHVVTGTPVDPANTVDNSVTVSVGSSSAICPTQLKTLALTGTGNPTPWVLGGLGLLQLGLALVAVGVVRRRMDNQSV
jgi:hypothetical protein